MPLAHQDAVADLEARLIDVGSAIHDRRRERRAAQRKPAASALLQIGERYQPMLDSQRCRRSQPVRLVAGRRVVTWLHPLDRVPELATAGFLRSRDHGHESPGHRLPPVLEGWLSRGMSDRAEALHATEVMDPVHRQDSTARAANQHVPQRRSWDGWLESAVSGYGEARCPSSSEELTMLTLTDSAVSAIRTLTSQPEQQGDTGLRIMAQGDGGASSFQLALVDGPAAGDQVVEEGGARVFVEATAAEVLEDKALDAQVNEQGDLAFRISDQADES